MKRGSIIGAVLVAGGAVLALWWLLRRRGGAAYEPGLGGIQRIGAEITQEVTPDLVREVLSYASAQVDRTRCWKLVGSNEGSLDTHDKFERSDSPGIWTYLPNGQRPANMCSDY